MNFAQALNGVAYGSLLMILSVGLAMIYGLRGVTNFAHGALYMTGAYLAYSFAGAFNFWVALILAPLCLAVIGAILELVFFKNLQERNHLEVGLITFGVAMILERVIVLIWGERTLAVAPPAGFEGPVSVLGTDYPAYRILLMVIAIVITVVLVLWLRMSKIGLHIRAASHDVETSAVLGINVDRVSLVVVMLGSAMAGMAGVLAAPYFSVTPGMGNAILIIVLIVVVIGGAGSIGGAMAAGMGIGIVQTLGVMFLPAMSEVIPYVALIIVLLVRPQGIAGRPLV